MLRASLIVTFIIITFPFAASAQIIGSVSTVNFGIFTISSWRQSVTASSVFHIRISKSGQVVIADSVITDTASCQGFSFPASQPFKDYYIFSKHQKKEGRTYILTTTGNFATIAGGTFWAAPKHKLLFILAEKDYRNLVVFSLQQMKTIFEKFSCDEFTDWYYRKGNYFGKVEAECGTELKPEKEVSEWMRPVEIEQFNVKLNTLNEMNITDEQVERSKPLIKYCACK